MSCFSVFSYLKSSNSNQKYVKNCEIVLIKEPTEKSTNIGSIQTLTWKSRVGREVEDGDSKTDAIDLDAESNTEIVSVKSEDEKEKNVKKGSEKLGVLVQLESAKERDDEKKHEKGTLGVLVQIETENERKEAKGKDLDVHVETENESEDESVDSSYISYPPLHRCHNYVIDEDEEHVLIQENSPESLFSLSIDPTRQSTSCPVEVDNKEVSSPLKTSSCLDENNHNHDKSIDSLLNPIENLPQWKSIKARPMAVLDHNQEKENLYLEQEEISKVSDQKGKLTNNTVVTTSLSGWLVDPEKSMVSKEESQYSIGSDGATSWKSFEGRPILEVFCIDARSSSRKSPCVNPDDTLIIGTVGSYWSHTEQATDSSNSCTSPLGISAKT